MALSISQFLENAGAVNHARDFRRIHDKMLMGFDVRAAGGLATAGLSNGGVARSGDLLVAQRAAGANMSVDIAVGFAMVGGTESATQGEYGGFNDAVTNVVISASDPTNPRIDVIGIRNRDAEYSGASNDAALIVVTGTPAGAPAVPTVPANFLTLAHVAVAAAAATIVNGNITDKRIRLSALGGIVVATSSATYPAANLYHGQAVFDIALQSMLLYNLTAAAWMQIGPLAAWATFTATLAQSGAVALTSAPGRYMRVGRFVQVQIKCTASGAGGGAAAITISGAATLPVASAAYVSANDVVGTFIINDSATFYHGYATIDTPATPTFRGISYNQVNYMGAAGPVYTIGAADVISVNAQYEAAA